MAVNAQDILRYIERLEDYNGVSLYDKDGRRSTIYHLDGRLCFSLEDSPLVGSIPYDDNECSAGRGAITIKNGGTCLSLYLERYVRMERYRGVKR